MEAETGLIVCASAGRDKDRFFVVVETGKGFAFIADGKSRKLASPKRKNTKHLRSTGRKIALTPQITDRKLRGLLKEFTL